MMHVTVRDLTESKRAEDTLNESRRYLQALFDNSLDAILVTNDDGRYIDANPAACALLGYTHEELIQLSISDLTAAPFRQEGWAMWQQFLSKGSNSGEYSTLRKDGTIIQLEFRAVANILPGIHVSCSRDITERKQAEEERKRVERAQRESRLQYETLVHSIDGIVWEVDPKTFRFTFVSKQAERILGYPLEQWFEGPGFWPDHMHPDDRDSAIAFCMDATARRVDHQFEYRMIAADGHVVWLSDIVTVHVVDDQPVLLRGVMVDITERKLAEEKLRQSESQLAEAQHLANVGSWNWNLENNTLSWSDELYHIFGVQPAEFAPLYETVIGLLHPEDRDLLRRVIDDSLKTHEPFSFYYRIIRPDGKERIIHSRGRVATNEHGTPARMFGAAQDVTERKRAEDSLREAERKYRDIFENAGEGIFQSTPDGRYIAANPAFARMHGFVSAEELIRRRLDISRQIYVDPSRREEFKRQLEEQGAVRGFEHQVYRKDGSKIWISVNARAVSGEQGAILYYEGTAQDITDRKRAEEALRESEERYRELFENAKDAIYVQDLGGVYISVNRAAEKLSGYDRKEILGKHFDQFVAPEYLPLVCANLAKKLADGEQTAYEIEVIARDGRRVPVELSSAVIFKHGVPVGIQGIARDITKRKRAEDDLRQQKEILQKIFDHIPVMIRLAGPDGDVQLVNREYERTTGWSLEEIQKEPLKIFAELYPDKHERQLILDRIARATGEWADFRTRARDGRVIDTSWANIRLSAGMSLGIGQDISMRKRAEETLRSYSRQLIEAQEAERQHIARELHDQIGQVLTAVRINLQTIWNSCETAESRSLIDQGVAAIDTALEQVRGLSFELRPSLLDDLGLVSALRWYSDQYTQRTGIRTRSVTNLPQDQTRLRRELETACFRIVQEALTNVVRHAKAKNVSIDLSKLDHQIVLSIKDDGIGFDESANGGASAIHLGLRGMKERALAVGGTLDIESGPARGTVVRAYFPTESTED
jgi:PAS domain S-box-containing protein